MRLRIHRGAKEIGGNCVELQSGQFSILIDLGLPLNADSPEPSLLPPVRGLTDGSNPNLAGIVLSHAHGDHYGLGGLVHPDIPIFIGAQARKLLMAVSRFMRLPLTPSSLRTYADQGPFELGPFRVTPFLTDHSAFDAYSLLIETDGKRIFYSGDLRAHGRKARLFEDLVADPPTDIDLLILEGTTLSRPDTRMAQNESDLENDILAAIFADKRPPLHVQRQWKDNGNVYGKTDHSKPAEHDPPRQALVHSIVRAHHWVELLSSGDVSSVEELAKREHIHPKVLRTNIRLAFIAPALAIAILDSLDVTIDLAQFNVGIPLRWKFASRIADPTNMGSQVL